MKKIGWLLIILLVLCSCTNQQQSFEKREIGHWDAEPFVYEPFTSRHEFLLRYYENSWKHWTTLTKDKEDPDPCNGLVRVLSVPERALDYAGEIFIALYGESKAHQGHGPILMGYHEGSKSCTVYFAPNKFSLFTSKKVIISFSTETGKVLGIEGDKEITPIENDPVINRLYWHIENVEIRDDIEPVFNAYSQSIIKNAQNALDIACAALRVLNEESYYKEHGRWKYVPGAIAFDQPNNRWLVTLSLGKNCAGGGWLIALDAKSSEVQFIWLGE